MIYNLKVNHSNLLFAAQDDIHFSFVSTKGEEFLFTLKEDGKEIVQQLVPLSDCVSFKANYVFKKGHKYGWFIAGKDEISEEAFFYVYDDLDSPFITTDRELTHPVFFKEFKASDVKNARLVITGLGLYVAFINNKRVGNYYLTPGFNDYDQYVRYQEYDVTDMIKENNIIEVVLGDGQYKGRMGFDGHAGNIYGDHYSLSAKLIIEDKDGMVNVIPTDTTWKAKASEFIFSTIYDGEIRNPNIENKKIYDTSIEEKKFHIIPQFNDAITAHECLKPELIITPLGEKVLDFKQNMAGFVRFVNRTPKGNVIHLWYGEVLQGGNFYRDNLRSAKAELIYTSDGKKTTVESFFTYYGFRYVKVEGIENIDVSDFMGVVLHSNLTKTIKCVTSNEKINRLISNALWGQKGNFLDVPTDCPQRDERLGWTGDTQVFATTASLNMNTERFYEKFMMDLRGDQTKYYDGDIPSYCPSLKKSATNGGAVWADVATILPMKVYEIFGNKELLNKNYPLMKDYTETLIANDEKTGNKHLVTNGFTFGDWLAMDGCTSQSRKGGTEDNYIQSFYYYNSLNLTARAAKELKNAEDYKKYNSLAKKVRKAILEEYFSKNGRLTIDTQTGYVLSLYYGIYIDKEKVINGFRNRLQKDFYTMKSGFTGTPLMLQTLMDNGMTDDAYRMLFSEKFPGWLFSINLGATTIWERWNSMLPDGTVSGTGMNSFNHYAYGSVCEAIYTRMAGLMNKGNAFKEVTINPHINYRLKEIDLTYNSIRGDYHIDYKINKDNSFVMNVTIPHGCKAHIILPSRSTDNEFDVTEGTYQYEYMLEQDYNHPFNMFTSMIDILSNKDAIQACNKYPAFVGIAMGDEEMSVNSPFVLAMMGFLPVNKTQAEEIDAELRKVSA